MRAQLVPLDGGAPIDILKDLMVIGRKDDCDLRLDHKSVSKMHCIVVKTDGLLLLRDLGSTNGTRVNGQRVRRAALLPNDQIAIANFRFRVYLGPDEEAPARPDEYTQQISPEELAIKLGKAKTQEEAPLDDSDEMPAAAPLQRNELPDVYPEDEKRG